MRTQAQHELEQASAIANTSESDEQTGRSFPAYAKIFESRAGVRWEMLYQQRRGRGGRGVLVYLFPSFLRAHKNNWHCCSCERALYLVNIRRRAGAAALARVLAKFGDVERHVSRVEDQHHHQAHLAAGWV